MTEAYPLQWPAYRPRTDTPERVVAAAIYHGATVSLLPPARHGQRRHVSAMCDAVARGDFATACDALDRFDRALHRAGQIIRHSGGETNPELYSEDLW